MPTYLVNLGNEKQTERKIVQDILQFTRNEEGRLKLHQTWFCGPRLRPVCNWRKSLKHS